MYPSNHNTPCATAALARCVANCLSLPYRNSSISFFIL